MNEQPERRHNVETAFCNERHKAIDEWKQVFSEDIKRDVQSLFKRLDWFYAIAIATLAATVANFFKG